jgi:hypothetical protein
MLTKRPHMPAQTKGRLYQAAAMVACASRIDGLGLSWRQNRLDGLDFSGTPRGLPR